MLRKTMIVLAKASALNSGLTVDAFAHGGGRGHGGGFGGGGHMGGFGGARIVADLALALRVHILGRRLGWRCLVLFSRPSPAKPPPTTSRAAKLACTTR